MEVEVLGAAPVVPITALQFTDRFLLSGEGSFCHLYELNTWSHLLSHRIFSSSSVHGIRPDTLLKRENLICFFGARSLRVVKFSESLCSEIDDGWDEIRLDEWIWDCAWIQNSLPFDGSDTDVRYGHIAAVLSHNSVVRVDIVSGSIVGRIQCAVSCILYSAKVIGQNWDSLILSVGTVFNEVILWSVTGPFNKLGHAEVMHTLTGHQGVVMGVEFDVSSRQICSVSDDRSVRIWRMAIPAEAEDEVGVVSGDQFLPVDRWRKATFQLVHILFGHASRVWDARILRDGYVSIGEDAVCCLWDSSGHVTQKFKGHQGRSIWSLAINSDESFIVTGGGDTSIRIWQRNSVLQLSKNVSVSELEIPVYQSGDFPRLVKLLSSSLILVMSNNGCLFKYDVPAKHWSLVMNDPSYASYSVVSLDPSASACAVGSINGMVKILFPHEHELTESSEGLEKELHKGKVHNILWFDDVKDTFLSCGQNGQMFVCQIKRTENSDGRSIVPLCELLLPPSKQHWATAVCLVRQIPILICGDREGSIFVYQSSSPGSEDILFHCLPVQSFLRLHGPNEVTSVSFHAGQIYTTGRDGRYRVFAISADHSLQLLSNCRVLKGLDWISKLMFHPKDILALGFHSRQFVIYSVITNQRLFSVPCGGGHRAWDFSMSFSDGDCHLVYVKKRRIEHYCAKVTSYQRILKPSLHGREISCVQHLFSRSSETGVRHFVTTGGEDGLLSVVSFSDLDVSSQPINNDLGMEVLASTQVPASSIRTCCISRLRTDGTESYLERLCRSVTFAGGSKGQIFAWKLGSSTDGALGNFFWDLLSSYSICIKGKKRLKPWKQHLYNPDVETRFMATSSFCLADIADRFCQDFHVVIAVCSVGIIRLLSFDENARVFRLIASSSFHANCLLKVQHFIHRDGENRTVYIASAGTDGRIALWDVTGILLEFYGREFAENALSDKIRTSKTTAKNSPYVDRVSCDAADVKLTDADDKFEMSFEMTMNDVKSSGDPSSSINFEKLSVSGKLPKSNSISEDLSAEESSSEASYSLDSSDEDSDASEKCGKASRGTGVQNVDQNSAVDFKEPVCVLRSHQSGINALDVIQCQGSSCLYAVVSGGDDAAMCLHILDVSNGANVIVVGRDLCVSAHYAQITGIRFLTDRMLISASIDQRLTLWTLEGDLPDLKLKAVRSMFTDVADVSDLETWTDGKETNPKHFQVLVSGIGLQYFKVVLK